MTFGEWTRQKRGEHDLTIAECAERAGMKWQQWSRMENDEPRRRDGSPPQPTRKTVEAVAHALALPPSQALLAAGYTPSAEMEEQPAIVAYYSGLPDDVQADVMEIVKALYLKHRKKDASYGKRTKDE